MYKYLFDLGRESSDELQNASPLVSPIKRYCSWVQQRLATRQMADKGLSFSLGAAPKRGAPGRLSFGLKAAPRAKPAAVFQADSSDDEAEEAPAQDDSTKRQRTETTGPPAASLAACLCVCVLHCAADNTHAPPARWHGKASFKQAAG